MAEAAKQLAGLTLPKPVLTQLEKSLQEMAEARGIVTKAEIGFMEQVRSIFTPSNKRGGKAPQTAGVTAGKNGKKDEKKVIAGTAPGAGQFKCPKADCEHNKKPFSFKMHAVLHANASKHGKPVEIKADKQAAAA